MPLHPQLLAAVVPEPAACSHQQILFLLRKQLSDSSFQALFEGLALGFHPTLASTLSGAASSKTCSPRLASTFISVMGKGSKNRKRDNNIPKKQKTIHYNDVSYGDMMDDDDEIDAFHKQRDFVPLDINNDLAESDDDSEQPVFEYEDVKGDDDDDDDDDEDGDDEDLHNDTQLKGLAAKIARQQKHLRAKIGGVEDEMHDDADEEEEKRAVWSRRKNIYYSADNVDYELQSSDEELPAEEEAEVLRLQKEKAKSLSMEDFGLEDVSQDENDGEPTIEEIVKGKGASKAAIDREAQGDVGTTYEEVKKDLTALSREEQMDVVYNSAPELVGLLSELNDGLEQIENKVNPLLSQVAEGEDMKKGGMNYFEVKQLLLLAYCQAITFYLLLKSEGQPVRDHPVIARLVEIKNLLDKMKQLDENLPSELEEILKKQNGTEKVVKQIKENASLESGSFMKDHPSVVSVEAQEAAVPDKVDKSVGENSLKNHEKNGEKRKLRDDQVGLQSMEMLKKRAELEEKLKQKGVFSSIASKHDKRQRNWLPVTGKLETLDDFNDDAMDLGRGNTDMNEGCANSLPSNKISQLVATQMKKSKAVSGDDDLPKRDDIGERRRKHELRVLAGAGIKSVDDVDGPNRREDSEMEGSEDDLYEQVGQKRAAKLAAKAQMYSRAAAVDPHSPESIVDGKRQITYMMEKNRGLTRARKKLTKNPRKKYKLKHQKALIHRKGQVRDARKPSGPYGGEASGINTGISRSIRFKN